MKRIVIVVALVLICVVALDAQIKVASVGGEVGFVMGSATWNKVDYAPSGFGGAVFCNVGGLIKNQPVFVRPEVSFLMGEETKNTVKQERTAINVNVFGVYELAIKTQPKIVPYAGIGGGLTMLSANVVLSGSDKEVTKFNGTVLAGGKYLINPQMAAGLEVRYGMGSGFDTFVAGATFTYMLK